MSAVAILEQARNIIANGWYQGFFCNTEGNCFCAMGALSNVVTNGERTSNPPVISKRSGTDGERALFFLRNAVSGKIPAEGEYGFHDIVGFNDRSSTKKEDVLKLFDVAICNARRRKTTKVPMRTAR